MLKIVSNNNFLKNISLNFKKLTLTCEIFINQLKSNESTPKFYYKTRTILQFIIQTLQNQHQQ